MPTPEGRIEDYFLKKCKDNNMLCWKFTSPSQNGVPDRIVLYKKHTYFVELKAPNETPRPDQLAVHKLMRKYGAVIFIADSEEKCNEIIETIRKRR